ncbi:hypothetical protein PAPHI01_1767 [Pancytospora philotis]|nr:hypothetical protein PAPHI01_1767 [Pancytospora philotis]
MFQFIKSIFTREKSLKGKLSIQNAAKGDATALYAGDELSFAVDGAETKTTLQIKDIKDLVLKAGTLRFSVHDKKYAFEAEDVQRLYAVLHPLVASSYIFETPNVTYLVYNALTRMFDAYEQPVVLRIFEDIVYYMRIEDPASIVHFEEISTSTQYYVDEAGKSFVWSTYSDGRFYTFCLRFSGADEFLAFRKAYVDSCYRSINNKDAYDYDKGLYSNISVYDEPAADAARGYEDDVEQAEENDDIADCIGSATAAGAEAARAAPADSNELLVMGNSQCFVTRGASLGVFDLNPDELKFRLQVKNVLDEPQKILTHNGDSSLLVLDRNDRSHLGLMDLNRGEIVEKWDMHTNVNDYFNSTKYADNGTLVGLSDYSLFRIDPRASERVVAKKEYKCKNEFSCGAATEQGHIAVASHKGDLRLYDKIDKRAKTLLPGFGDPVLGVDTSKDGRLVLCTCKSYILLFRVDANYAKNSKDAVPVRLQLKPQHLALFSDNISFSPAKFDQEDSVIISSTGRYIIKWKVDDVLKSQTYRYTLKSLGERVVDEDFITNGSDIVVATKNDVRKLNESDLRRPN